MALMMTAKSAKESILAKHAVLSLLLFCLLFIDVSVYSWFVQYHSMVV